MQNHVGVDQSETETTTIMFTVKNTQENTGIQRQYKKQKDNVV